MTRGAPTTLRFAWWDWRVGPWQLYMTREELWRVGPQTTSRDTRRDMTRESADNFKWRVKRYDARVQRPTTHVCRQHAEMDGAQRTQPWDANLMIPQILIYVHCSYSKYCKRATEAGIGLAFMLHVWSQVASTRLERNKLLSDEIQFRVDG